MPKTTTLTGTQTSTSGHDPHVEPSDAPLAGLVHFGGRNDSKLILSEAALDKVARKAFSPSAADSMNGCTARWVIEKLLPRAADPFGAAELGTAAHRVFEIVFSLPSKERTTKVALETVASLQHDPEVVVPSDPEDLDRWHNSVTKLVTGLWAIENPRAINVVGLELEIKNIEVAGVPFVGFIDRVSSDSSGLCVDDYKSGKIPNLRYGDKHGDQIRLYGEALAQHPDFDRPTSGSILYTQFQQRTEVDMSEAATKKTLEKFANSWDIHNKLVASGEFTTKTGALCGWCPAVMVCPAAQAKDLGPRIEHAEHGDSLGLTTTPVAVAIAGHEPERRDTTSADTKTKEVTMSTFEEKPWEERNYDGSLSLNSYASTAVFGIVELAVESLARADQPINSTNVTALSETIAHVVHRAYESLGDEAISWQSGRHSRLRGAVRTTLETLPMPFGEDEAKWDEWVRRAVVRTKAIAHTAVALWESENIDGRPWEALATSVPVDEFADE